jgi:hypothetical protein
MTRRFSFAMFLGLSAAACSSESSSQATPTQDASVDASADVATSDAELASYVIPGTEGMAGIALDRTRGVFYVDSAESGRIYRGTVGADRETPLELFADLSATIPRGAHLAVTPKGDRLLILEGGFIGAGTKLHVVDVASRTVTRTVDLSAGAGGLVILQDIACDDARAYVTNTLENQVHVVDLSTWEATRFPIGEAFPLVSDPSRGFLNATGVALAKDGRALLIVHLIDKHLYRVSLDPATLGQATRVDSAPWNVSGNGLFLGDDGQLLEVASDELRVYRFRIDDAFTRAVFEAKYTSDRFEQGLTYAVAHGGRVLVLNGSGQGIPAPPPGDAGLPEGGPPDGFTGPPPAGETGGDAGQKKLPIRVLQLPL